MKVRYDEEPDLQNHAFRVHGVFGVFYFSHNSFMASAPAWRADPPASSITTFTSVSYERFHGGSFLMESIAVGTVWGFFSSPSVQSVVLIILFRYGKW